MSYPAAEEFAGKDVNKFELVMGAAKAARRVKNESLKQRSQREYARDVLFSTSKTKEANDSDESALSVAIDRIAAGRYEIIHADEADRSGQ